MLWPPKMPPPPELAGVGMEEAPPLVAVLCWLWELFIVAGVGDCVAFGGVSGVSSVR